MKDVYKNIKNIGSMVCKRWSRWSFSKKKRDEASVGKGFSVWMATVVTGGQAVVIKNVIHSKKYPFYSKK